MFDLLRIIGPSLPGPLVDVEDLRLIEKLSGNLPPLGWGGFECPLGPKRGRVDFHQGLTGIADARSLARSELLAPLTGQNREWQRIRDLCRQWGDDLDPALSVLGRVGLEYDIGQTGAPVPPPSVFWSFRHPDDGIIDRRSQLEAMLAVSRLLTGDADPPPFHSDLTDLQRRLPEESTILHAGIMLGRRDAPLRVNVWGLELDAISSFVAELDRGHKVTDIDSFVTSVSGQVNSIVIGFEIGPSASGIVGLECLVDHTDTSPSDWMPLFQNLEGRGLSTLAQREAVLSWPGRDDPATSATSWPDHLIIRSLQQPPGRMSTIVRSISHVKIAVPVDGEPAAKVYLEYDHSWFELE